MHHSTQDPRISRGFQFVPDRLIAAYAHDPLALGVWAVVAFAAYRAQGAVPLSAVDLAAFDGIPTEPHRVALMRRVHKLAQDGWLDVAPQPGSRKHMLRPTWGRSTQGTVHPWAFTRTNLGRPAALRARRLPVVLVEEGLGRMTPQLNTPALITRPDTSADTSLHLHDLGMYIRALLVCTSPTTRLHELDLIRDGHAVLPTIWPPVGLPNNLCDAPQVASAQATITLTGIPSAVHATTDGVWLTLHTSGDADPVFPALPTTYTVYVPQALWNIDSGPVTDDTPLIVSGVPFIDRVTDQRTPRIAVRAHQIRSAERSPNHEQDQDKQSALEWALTRIVKATSSIACRDPESESINQPSPIHITSTVGTVRRVKMEEEPVDQTTQTPVVQKVTFPHTAFSIVDHVAAPCENNHILDEIVRTGHQHLNLQYALGRGEWHELLLLQHQFGADKLLMWQERAARRQQPVERLLPGYYRACAARDALAARNVARADAQRRSRGSAAPALPLDSAVAVPPNARAHAHPTRDRVTPSSRWHHPDAECAATLRDLGIVQQGALEAVDRDLILAWRPYANHLGLCHEKRNPAGYIFTELLSGRAPDHATLNTWSHKWGGSLDPAAQLGPRSWLHDHAAQCLQEMLHATG